MKITRKYSRIGGLIALVLVVWWIYVSNTSVLPFGKPGWAPRFSDPGPPLTDKDVPHTELPSNLTLHLIPHSHSDIGWNLSFQQYYLLVVRNVLRQVTKELWLDSRRRFVWGDLAFLDLWMEDEGDQLALDNMTWQQLLTTLVEQRRMDLVGATYVSPDEGMATWWAQQMIVDVGRRTLQSLNLTRQPKVAWQIDNFGHHRVTPYLLSNMGFDKLVMGRMSYPDLQEFQEQGNLQFNWGTRESRLLVHFLSVHYGYFSHSFDFDNTAKCNVEELLEELKRFAVTQVRQYPNHGHVVVMMGDDFRYRIADRAFHCLDQLTQHTVGDDIQLKYSTPSEYFDAIQPFLSQKQLRLYQGDFYPYQDKPYEQYWSGILGSRPSLKARIRQTEDIVQHVESLLAISQIHRGNVNQTLEHQMEYCRKQVAIGYHHDAITGTCTESAFEDYVGRLERAEKMARQIGQSALGQSQVDRGIEVNSTFVVSNANSLVGRDQVAVQLQMSAQNIQIIDRSTNKSIPPDHIQAADSGIEFVASNVPAFGYKSFRIQTSPQPIAVPSITHSRTAVLSNNQTSVRLRLKNNSVHITIGDKRVVHQLRYYFANPWVQSSGAYIWHSFMLMYAFVFYIFGGALVAGLAIGCLRNKQQIRTGSKVAVLLGGIVGSAFTYYVEQIASVDRLNLWSTGHGLPTLVIPAFVTGLLVSKSQRWTALQCIRCIYGVAIAVVVVLFYFPEWHSRPLVFSQKIFKVSHGPVCHSAHLGISDTISLTYRLCQGDPHLQVTAQVTSQPNTELVGRFQLISNQRNSQKFQTFDGTRMIQRQYRRWTPIPGNYYPSISLVNITGMALHSRQAMGVTCIKENVLEVMLHRSFTGNDYRGLKDPLEDKWPARVSHWIDVSQHNLLVNSPPLVLAADDSVLPEYSAAGEVVPDGVRISGIQAFYKNQRLGVMARVQSLNSPLYIDKRELMATASEVYEVEGDWSILDPHTYNQKSVDQIMIARGHQKLYKFLF